MHNQSLSVLVVLGALAGVGALVFPCSAQTQTQISPTPPPVQNQPNQPTQAGVLPPAPNTGGSTQATTGLTSVPVPGVGTTTSSSAGKTFGSAGRGLPGMPGGPAVNGSMGAQDPSSQYMRPLSIPPVLCDPAVNIPC
jgi:hypothetical protein